jgi:hypothetical protein
MKYWHPHLPFGQHISVSTLVVILKQLMLSAYEDPGSSVLCIISFWF